VAKGKKATRCQGLLLTEVGKKKKAERSSTTGHIAKVRHERAIRTGDWEYRLPYSPGSWWQGNFRMGEKKDQEGRENKATKITG